MIGVVFEGDDLKIHSIEKGVVVVDIKATKRSLIQVKEKARRNLTLERKR